MEWERLGQIFKPLNDACAKTHVQVPTVLPLQDRWRIYYTTRPARSTDGAFTSSICFVDVSPGNPRDLLYVHRAPVIPNAEIGAFDYFGTMPGHVIAHDNCFLMYYTGWQRGVDVPYCTGIGLAESHDGGMTFHRVGTGSILGRSLRHPFLVNGPFVFVNEGTWHMWFSSAMQWSRSGNRLEAIYTIHHATSTDGIRWQPDDTPCVPTELPNECQNRPAVVQVQNGFLMFFSYRYGTNFRNPERGYRLGMAFSSDMREWKRVDYELSLEPSTSGWDSEMMAYPFPCYNGHELFLFYNGNYFGRDAFGAARLVDPTPYVLTAD